MTVATTRNGKFAEISIADTGSGVSEEAAKKIFDPFFSTKDHGMGMGLSIVRTIIEAHNDAAAGGVEVVLHLLDAAEVALMAALSSPAGSPPEPPMICQNIVWLACPPPSLRTRVRMLSGQRIEVGEDLVQRLCGPVAAALRRRGVEVVDVGRMVAVVMDLHRLGVDVRLVLVCRVGQGIEPEGSRRRRA